MGDGKSQTPGRLGPARQHYLLGVLPVGTQAEGGSLEARWHGVKVLTQGAKASSDFGQEHSQGRRMDGQAQGMKLDHGQKQVKIRVQLGHEMQTGQATQFKTKTVAKT